jgi:hypothetical protein
MRHRDNACTADGCTCTKPRKEPWTKRKADTERAKYGLPPLTAREWKRRA